MKFFALFAISAAFIASSECFRLNVLEENINEDRIYGGKTARPGQFPYMASLRAGIERDGKISWRLHKCGGGILSNRWVVTAAQCTPSNVNTSNLGVAVGTHRTSSEKYIYRLDRIVIHPAFDRGLLSNDVSLLRTVEKIGFRTGIVQSISLRKEIVGADTVAVTSGWGYVKGGKVPPMYLQYLEVKTMTNPVCHTRTRGEYRHRIHDDTLCAYADLHEGVCEGDAGNPLVANGTLIGLASWHDLCARGVPDFYVRISNFVYWIRRETGIQAV